MRKWILLVVGACILVLATGCSQSSQASDSSKSMTQPQQQGEQPNNKDKQQKESAIANPIENFDWKVFSDGKSGKGKKNKEGTQTGMKDQQGIIPVKIRIPAINVKTEVIQKGLVKEGKYKGHMATPENAVQTAWFKLGPKPGEKGAAIIAGHVDTYKGPGVFFNLPDLEDGDLVYITGKNGKTLTFKVYKKKAYPRKDVPLRKVFGYTPAKVVELITCTGDFIESEGTHNKRLVVSAVLMEKGNSDKGKS